jgi:hypothetical protein
MKGGEVEGDRRREGWVEDERLEGTVGSGRVPRKYIHICKSRAHLAVLHASPEPVFMYKLLMSPVLEFFKIFK